MALEISYETQLVFYQNPRGGYAVSTDGGDTVWLHTGRQIDLAGSVWVEADDEEVAEKAMSAPQRAAIAEIRSRKNATGIDAILLKSQEARRNLRGYYAKEPPPPPVVPEGALVVKSDLDD